MGAIILGLIYQNYRRSKRSLATMTILNEEIKRQKEALEVETRQRQRMVTEAVIKAQENERSSIGLELHDNVNQVLTTVKLQNEMLLDGFGDSKTILKKSSQYLQECINEIRSLSRRLSAPTLGKIRLEDSVKDLIESISLTNKFLIRSEIAITNNNNITPDTHLALYRILQEQMNNVLKHAAATEVKIQLVQSHKALQLTIVDNGQGFDMATKRAGIGITNMKTRAENLHGSFEIKSAPGEGCSIQVVIPIE
ncbi:MAG: hypothetical protein JWP69_2365 [Flaviaesturariibacter sp.]|nr:hypothetical protein [Flaviaesturariibacter sp.]